jgi:hypothetical protein
MSDPIFAGRRGLCRWWSAALSCVVHGQFALLDAQFRGAVRVLEILRGRPPADEARARHGAEAAALAPSAHADDLSRQAAERLRHGFAPPRNIYDVQNRARIDWTQVPDWARPSDPELFGGPHEG